MKNTRLVKARAVPVPMIDVDALETDSEEVKKINKNITSPEEFAIQMKELATDDDIEMSHIYMDALMEKVLKELGYEKGIDIFKNTEKWYS